MHHAEAKGLRDWRKQLLQNISGDVLELGCGTGANFEFYLDAVKRIVFIGRSDKIRTCDPCLPKAVLYQAELHSD